MLTYQWNFLSSCPHLLSAVVTAMHHHTSFKGCQGLNPGLCACRHSTTWATFSAPYCLYSDFFICRLTLCVCVLALILDGRPSPFDHHPLLCAFSQLIQAASLSWESFGFRVLVPVTSTDGLRMTGWWMLSSPYHGGMFALPAVEASLLQIFLGLRSLTDGSQRRPGMP